LKEQPPTLFFLSDADIVIQVPNACNRVICHGFYPAWCGDFDCYEQQGVKPEKPLYGKAI
jgi:hypothetical protein